MQQSASGEAFTQKWEGTINYVYDDARSPPARWVKNTAVDGNLTAGTGHLLSAAEAKQWTGKTITVAQINAWYDVDNNEAERAVNTLVKVKLTQNQFDALVDFVFNIGVTAFATSTLLKKLNKGDYASVSAELMKWTKTRIKGVRVNSAGLQARRAAEGVLFNSGVTITTTYRDITPKKPAPIATEIAVPGPKDWSPTEKIAAGSTVATVAAAGFSTQGVLMYVFAGILVLTVVVIGAIAIKRYWFRS